MCACIVFRVAHVAKKYINKGREALGSGGETWRCRREKCSVITPVCVGVFLRDGGTE